MTKKQCPVHPNIYEDENNPCPICFAFKDIWGEAETRYKDKKIKWCKQQP